MTLARLLAPCLASLVALFASPSASAQASRLTLGYANAQAIQSFRAAYAESITWIAANPEEARKIEAQWLGFNGRAFPNFSLELRQSDFDTYVAIGRELGVMRQAVDTSRLIWK